MRALLAFILSLCLAVPALAATPEEELQQYIGIFKGGKGAHATAADEFEWKGFSDPRLFDAIEALLVADYETARAEKREKRRVFGYIRALGYSGQAKYEKTIARFKEDPDYQGHAAAALRQLPVYAKWNPVISARDAYDPKASDDGNRVMNMLRSGDLMLMRLGAKRVFFKEQQDAVVDVLAGELRKNYGRAGEQGEDSVDAVAWMVRALGRAGNAKHRAVLQEVQAKSSSDKILRHAEVALKTISAR